MEPQGAKRYLLMGLGRGGGGRRRFVDGEQWWSAYGIGSEGVLVEDRRRGAVGELCESEVELMAGSAWAEEVWNGGSTMSSSLPAFGWTTAALWGLGRGTGEVVRGIGCGDSPSAEACERWGSRALSRARHDGGEVAATELDWAAWQWYEGSSARWSGARRSRGCRVWRWSSRRWPAALLGGGRHCTAPAAERSREGEMWEMTAGLVCNFCKIHGSYCKTKITPKLGLK